MAEKPSSGGQPGFASWSSGVASDAAALAQVTPTPSPQPVPTATPQPVPATVSFKVPVYKQTMNLDCETAALQMGLAALGHSYSQAALFAFEPQDKRPPVIGYIGSQKIVIKWGNPYRTFVGDVNGADLTPSGYGIYYPVILSIAQSHGAPNSIGGEGFTASTVYAALAAGHPVVVWTETGWERPYVGYWTTFDGSTRIRYSLVEHSVTLSGISPTMVRVNDPWHQGSQYWYPKAAFEQSWADFDNMAVILQ